MTSRVAKYMSLEKRKINMRTFFQSQFTYCPFIWMFCDRGLNHKINHLHERALHISHNDTNSTFDALLDEDFVVIHQRNSRSLLIKMYKIHPKISPSFICDLISESRSHCKITEKTELRYPRKTYNIISSNSFIEFIQAFKAILALDWNFGTFCLKIWRKRIHQIRLNLNWKNQPLLNAPAPYVW